MGQQLLNDNGKQHLEIVTNMKLECIESIESFMDMADEWNGLLERSSANSLFLTHEWLSNWWRSYHESKNTLMVITIRENGILIGAAPMMVSCAKRYGLSFKKISFIGDPTWTTGNFIIIGKKDVVLSRIVHYLIELKWTVMELGCLPEESKAISTVEELFGKSSIKYSKLSSANSPYLSIDSDWDTFYAERSTRFKKALRNKQNKIKKTGNTEVSLYSTAAELKQIISSVMELARKGWKHQINNSIASENGNNRFYTALTDDSKGHHNVNIWVLALDGTPVAYEYHIKYDNITYGITADYDTEYRNLSPGSILDFNIVKSKFEEPDSVYDLGCGDSFYKKNWTKEANRYVNIVAYNNNLCGRLLHLIDTKISPAVKRLFIKRTDKAISAK